MKKPSLSPNAGKRTVKKPWRPSRFAGHELWKHRKEFLAHIYLLKRGAYYYTRIDENGNRVHGMSCSENFRNMRSNILDKRARAKRRNQIEANRLKRFNRN